MSSPAQRLLVALALALALAPLGHAGLATASACVDVDDTRAPSVLAHCLRGRAHVASEAGVEYLSARARRPTPFRAAHVELGASSRLSVQWPEKASARIDGKASFGFAAADSWSELPSLSLYFVRNAEIEVRRGTLRLELAHGWSMTCGRSALAVRGRVDGRVELENRGGGVLRVERTLGEDETETVEVGAGRTVVLDLRPSE